VSSRAAENLFWMGRYAERAENAVRLARVTLTWLSGDEDVPERFLEVLGRLCTQRGLVPADVPSPAQGARVFERALVVELDAHVDSTSVAFNLGAMAHAASQIRDRLSPTHWRLVLSAGEEFDRRLTGAVTGGVYPTVEALSALEHLGMQLSAITGAQTDRMTRDDGWRLLTIGRQIERLSTMSSTLWTLFDGEGGLSEPEFDLILDLFDSTITYRAHYQRRQEIPALLDLVVMDEENPRSLACILAVLRQQIILLPGTDAASGGGPIADLLALLPSVKVGATLEELCARDGDGCYWNLLSLTARLSEAARALSDEIGRLYFSHAAAGDQSLAA